MKEVFGQNGILSSVDGRFEPREEQTRMADFILEALCDGVGCFVEAGTGVGKTLAYLVPAISYCIENDKRLWVSTETRALQKQLLEKDIPVALEVVRRLTGREFSFELCMGSANYPCRRRFEALVERGEFHKAELHWLEELRALLDRGEPVTRFTTRMPQPLWSRLSRESDACGMFACPFASGCAFQLARRRWQQADVLILNKADAVDGATLDDLLRRAAAVNPRARLFPARQGGIAFAELDALLCARKDRSAPAPPRGPLLMPREGNQPTHEEEGYQSRTVRFREPVTAADLRSLLTESGPGLCRAKGLVELRGEGPRVVQYAAGRLAFEPAPLGEDDEAREGYLVLIGTGLRRKP